MVVQQLERSHQPAAGFAGANDRQDVVREDALRRLQRVGEGHALGATIPSHFDRRPERLGWRATRAQFQRLPWGQP